MRYTSLLALVLSLVGSCAPEAQVEKPVRPRNIILFIGDGMGLSQVSASHFYKEAPVNFDRFGHIGLIKTYSSSHKITDSASGANAFSTGEKTYNGAIGVDSDTVALPTIIEILEDKGYKSGLIATSSITHATPAAFYAHVKSRGMHEDIAAQLVDSNVDFFAGGGTMFFNNRSDGINYIDSLVHQGFVVDTSALSSANLKADQKYGYLLAADGMPRMVDGRGNFLAEATKLAIEYLSQSEEGFFLMIEGSQIDWGGHSNDADYLISELLDFDSAIGVGLDFAEQDENTLVLVSADHETGGFTLSAKVIQPDDTSMMGTYSDYNQIAPTFSTGGHSATMIPVFAQGPGAVLFDGIYENNQIFDKMLAALGEKP